MNTIKEQWDSYSKQVLPRSAPDVQRSETKLAFYAGAQAVLNIMWGVAGSNVSDQGGAHIVEGLHQECQEFARAYVKVGKAP